MRYATREREWGREMLWKWRLSRDTLARRARQTCLLALEPKIRVIKGSGEQGSRPLFGEGEGAAVESYTPD